MLSSRGRGRRGAGARAEAPALPEVDRLALLQGVRRGEPLSELARQLGVSRATIRRLLVAERYPRR